MYPGQVYLRYKDRLLHDAEAFLYAYKGEKVTEHIQIKNVRPRVQYIGDGAQKVFPYAFGIFDETNIKVYIDEQLQETGYTVTGVGNTTGGSVVFGTPPVADCRITIVRDLPIERVSDFQEGGELRAKVLNDELDYQTACMQQIAQDLNRSMVLPKYAKAVNMELPAPQAGKAILWNADGTALENSVIPINAMIGVLDEKIEIARESALMSSSMAVDCVEYMTTCETKASEAQSSAQSAQTALTGIQTAIANKVNSDGSNMNLLSFLASLGLAWVDTGTNGGCYCLPFGVKIQTIRIAQNANNFTWVFPVAFTSFYHFVSNANVGHSGESTLSSLRVADNNFAVTTKHGYIDLIVIGI